jgi:predicted transcriptional regulator
MDTIPFPQDGDRPEFGHETAEERQRRLAREAAMIDRALASAASGRVVPLEAVEAWVDSWGTDHELPRPRSGR